MNDRITIQDIRDAAYCTRGAKRWFDEHGLDFRQFLKEGLPEDVLKKTGCGLILDVIEKKKAKSDG